MFELLLADSVCGHAWRAEIFVISILNISVSEFVSLFLVISLRLLFYFYSWAEPHPAHPESLLQGDTKQRD